MPLTAARTCRCNCNPCVCGDNETEPCPRTEVVTGECVPEVQENECKCTEIPFGEKFSAGKLPYPAGSLVSTECGLFYTACKAYSSPGKSPWRKFDPKVFFQMYGLFASGILGLKIAPIGCTDDCGKVYTFDEGDIGLHDGKLWISEMGPNASIPPNGQWRGGVELKLILHALIDNTSSGD